ncbi:MAG: hypothetical protein ACLPKB_24970 [Xanthobacteraceae bacterium]
MALKQVWDGSFYWWLHRIILSALAIAFFVTAGVFIRYIFTGTYRPRSALFFVVSTVIVIVGGLGAMWLMLTDSGIR